MRYIRVHLSSLCWTPRKAVYSILLYSFNFRLCMLCNCTLWTLHFRMNPLARLSRVGKIVPGRTSFTIQRSPAKPLVKWKTGERGEQRVPQSNLHRKGAIKAKPPGKTYDLIRRRTAPSSDLLEIPHFCEPALVGLYRPVIFRAYL